MNSIYMDYAAATPLDVSVLDAMKPYFTEAFYNPSALYLSAKGVHKDVSEARERIARTIGAKPSEIVFTAGGTEANNLAVRGVISRFPEANMVVSAIEHESVLEPAKTYGGKIARAAQDGRIDIEHLVSLIDDQTVLVSVMYANNEIGTVQSLRVIATELEELRKLRMQQGNKLPLYLHTDAAQATAYLDMHVSTLGVDLMTINGGKIYGPKQTGFLYVKTGVELDGMILGGGQERGYRSGTENVPGIMGLAKAIELVTERKKAETKRLLELRNYFVAELDKKVPEAVVNGSRKHRLPNNVHITLPGADNERLLMELDERGIQCATGSACSASNDEPSHVLAACGMDQDDIRASLRFTMGVSTTKQHIDTVISALSELVN